MRLLVTGGAGFIGSNFVRTLLAGETPGTEVTVLDKLTYAGSLENLKTVRKNIRFIKGDICKPGKLLKDTDVVVNFAAETHVDRSISGGEAFVRTDVLGTYFLLEAARREDVGLFVQVSTDEVYGSRVRGSFTEKDAIEPNSVYSASKAGGDMLVRAFNKTHGLRSIITRSSNNFGPYQHPEKFVPLFITNAILGKPLPLYGKGENVRDWIYVEDNCRAIETCIMKGKPGETYNISSRCEMKNVAVAKMIVRLLGKPESLINFVEDRPGHDFRYSLDSSKIRKLGWKPGVDFGEGLRRTIDWYTNNKWWWNPLVKDSDRA